MKMATTTLRSRTLELVFRWRSREGFLTPYLRLQLPIAIRWDQGWDSGLLWFSVELKHSVERLH
jgi:hypothetical protein